MSRRRFLGSAAAAGGFLAAPAAARAAGSGTAKTGRVPMRTLGKSGVRVSALGLGGYHLGAAASDQEATDIVARAMDAGVNFFDNAWEYHEGESERRLGLALKGRRDQAVVMTKVCTHGRDKAVAMRMLEESLKRLGTDHLDVWQVHEVVYENDPELIFAPDGVAEALLAAKQQGKVRLVGFTGHKDPSIHLRMLRHGFPFDTVQMPLNVFDASFRSFEQRVLPEARRQGLGVLGMKSLGGSGEAVKAGAITPEEGLAYAMSLPVSVTISGIDAPWVLEQNLAVARDFQPLSSRAMTALRDRVRAYAGDGRFELFKTSTKYDGKPGRQQHGYPDADAMPA